MKDAPAFDFYPERFWFAVEGWSEQEICRYARLLGQQWMRDGLPESRKDLEGLARGKLSDRVFEKFPLTPDGKRRNPFMEVVRAAQRKRRADRARGASLTNSKRWGQRNPEGTLPDRPAHGSVNGSSGHSVNGSANGSANGSSVHSLNGSTHRSATTERYRSESPSVTRHPSSVTGVLFEKEPEEFCEGEGEDHDAATTAAAIYAAYPRKVARPPALKAIAKALAAPPPGIAASGWAGELLAITGRYAELRRNEPGQFTPHPATWFNERRFEDDPSTWVTPAGGSSRRREEDRVHAPDADSEFGF